MNCPICGFKFSAAIAVGASSIPDLAPMLCEICLGICLFENGAPRKATGEEIEAIKLSPAYREILEPVIRLLKAHKKAKEAWQN